MMDETEVIVAFAQLIPSVNPGFFVSLHHVAGKEGWLYEPTSGLIFQEAGRSPLVPGGALQTT